MGSIYSLGAICSLPLAAYLNDRIGRRKTIVAGSSVMVFAACLQAASQNFAMFVCSRLILGFGIPACIIGASSLIGELSYPKERPVMTSLFNTSWFIGSICAAGVTYGTYAMQSNWGWRLPSLLQAVPSLMQISFMW